MNEKLSDALWGCATWAAMMASGLGFLFFVGMLALLFSETCLH